MKDSASVGNKRPGLDYQEQCMLDNKIPLVAFVPYGYVCTLTKLACYLQ